MRSSQEGWRRSAASSAHLANRGGHPAGAEPRMVNRNEPTQELSIDEQRCSTHAVTDAGYDVGSARGLSPAGKVEDKGELICQPRADPTLLGYGTPHRRAAASSRMGQVGKEAPG
jgi:hypothetical protein